MTTVQSGLWVSDPQDYRSNMPPEADSVRGQSSRCGHKPRIVGGQAAAQFARAVGVSGNVSDPAAVQSGFVETVVAIGPEAHRPT